MNRWKTFFGVVMIGIFGMLVCGCSLDENTAEPINMKKTLDAKGIQRIEIHGKLANISIHPSDQDQIQAQVTGEVSKQHHIRFQADTQGDLATIKFSQDLKQPVSIQVKEHIPQFEIHLPKKMYQKITFQTTFGNLTANQKLLAKQIHIQADDGNVILNGYQGDKLQGSIKFGNITVKELDASVNLQTDEGKANLTLRQALKGQNRIQTKFGDVQVNFPKDPESLLLDLKSEYGEIKSDFSSVPSSDQDLRVFKRKIGQPTNHSPTLSIVTDNGDIVLKKLSAAR